MNIQIVTSKYQEEMVIYVPQEQLANLDKATEEIKAVLAKYNMPVGRVSKRQSSRL